MKICPSCGMQYDDANNFCNACGTMLNAADSAPETPEVCNKPNVLMSFLGNLLAIFSAMFGACSVASAAIDGYVSYSKYSSSINVYGYIENSPASAVIALLLALGALAFGVIHFIQVLQKKAGKEALFSAICRIAGSVALLIFSIVLCANME